jgi:endogenous inhibitor of DNA gyrase (YacG/DUF329 family)
MPTCERCGEPFKLTHPLKRFCSERCQRNDANARYRKNRAPEPAVCPNCGKPFERDASTNRKRVYCTTACQYEARSAEYRNRPDIKANLKRAQRVRRRRAKGQPDESTVIFL